MALPDYIKNGKVLVRKEAYAIIKAKASIPGAFAVIYDVNETTVVIDQSRIVKEQAVEIERGWRLLTFDVVLPFDLVGFLAKVSQALADEGISIFALSAYSKDHILVRKRDIRKTMKELERLGFAVEGL